MHGHIRRVLMKRGEDGGEGGGEGGGEDGGEEDGGGGDEIACAE